MTIFTLASRQEQQHVERFWIHLSSTRRQLSHIQWASPLYLEQMVQTYALVPVQQRPYIVVWFMSATSLDLLLDTPALRELVEGADRKIPFIISQCAWDEWPSPFMKYAPLVQRDILAEKSVAQREEVLLEATKRLRAILLPQEGRSSC